MIDPGKDFWPKSIAHLSQTYLNTADALQFLDNVVKVRIKKLQPSSG